MTQPTDQPAVRQALDELIAEAVGAPQTYPPHWRLKELNQALRAAIGDLYLAAQEQAAAYPEGSRDWHRIHNLLAKADETLAEDLGDGYLSAAIHVAALARHCRNLTAPATQERTR